MEKAAQFRLIHGTDTCVFPGYDRLGEEAGRTVLRTLWAQPVSAIASISTLAPDGSAETSIVARAGGASVTYRA